MKKLFTNDSFFLATALCTAIAGIACAVFSIISWGFGLTDFLIIVIRVCCGIVLYFAYKKHEKNVMKGMMGALLMIQLVGSILNFSLFESAANVFIVLLFIFTVALFINHFIINSDHYANPMLVYFNQILTLLIILTNVVWIVYDICTYPNLGNIIADVLDAIAYGGVWCVIICVESRLDAYRLDREAAGWTEEKGYPEGYVHEYEKNK